MIAEKTFKPVNKCCNKNCHNLIKIGDQEKQFKSFWEIADYNFQNFKLFGLMAYKNYFWDYFVDTYGEKKKVCQNFLLKLLQINRMRLRIIQNKLKNG
jgi:hypothetical protein